MPSCRGAERKPKLEKLEWQLTTAVTGRFAQAVNGKSPPVPVATPMSGADPKLPFDEFETNGRFKSIGVYPLSIRIA
jgi:hypothetical protein